MLLYSPYNTPRLQYIVDFVNKELFGDTLSITTDREGFAKDAHPKLNYSDEEISEEEFFIRKTPLLFETGIRSRAIECFDLNYHKAFFETSGDFPFDIFAASFYLLSRYEEYLPHEKDEYGRYAHTNSIAFREGFLHIPLVNVWLQEFRKALQEKFPSIAFHRPSFKFIPTYDIDIAYAYLNKGWRRNAGGLARSLLKGDWAAARERCRVLIKRQKDPYDAYEWLDSVHLYCRMRAYYFFLAAREPHLYDRNISRNNSSFRDLIRYHANGYTIGIHPSWQSGDDAGLLEDEIDWLGDLVGKKVVYSRQHFIRFTLPETYRQLSRMGIEKEFSMGYGTINGFRASVASSFHWYDLEREEKTGLMLFPFCFMDANAFYEQKLAAREAFHELMNYYHAIKKVNGMMVTIWHNQFLAGDPQFTGWKEVYEVFLKEEVYWDM
ncbi:MAG TPA: polysaccharide deacetylase family protein [Puia sp.]|nr:polysaccharide deacetylase family protein [Puia sp.]